MAIKDLTASELVEKINSDTTPRKPEQVIKDVVSVFRKASMEENNIMNSSVIIVSKKGTFTECPIPFNVLRSEFGMSLFKTLMKELDKEDIHSVVELAFGFGIVKSLRDKPEAKEEFEKLKKEVEAIKETNNPESIKNHEECQQYMLVNIYTPDHAILNFYDVIRTSNEDATVISSKPVVKEKIKHGKHPQITNYFL